MSRQLRLSAGARQLSRGPAATARRAGSAAELEQDPVTLIQNPPDSSEWTMHVPGLPGPGAGIRILVAADRPALASALALLRADVEHHGCCTGVDLEWRADGFPPLAPGETKREPNRAAMMQLGGWGVVVLVRFSSMGFELHPELQQFLRDPALRFASFGWGSSDEGKAELTFGRGRQQLFHELTDLLQLAQALGYHRDSCNLGSLARLALNVNLVKKRKKVTLSNWERPDLSASQVQYAALDGLLPGRVCTQLLTWQAAGGSGPGGAACGGCGQAMGQVLAPARWRCLDCDLGFPSRWELTKHEGSMGGTCTHLVIPEYCPACERVLAQGTSKASPGGGGSG